MTTKLTLNYKNLSGNNGKLNLPFNFDYLKESPFEILKNLAINYNINEYLGIKTGYFTPFRLNDSTNHPIEYGFSIEESKEKETISVEELLKNKLSFFHSIPNESKEYQKLRIKSLIKTYLVQEVKNGKIEIHNYFEERKISKIPEKEEKISQIIEYAQATLNKPEFSLSNLEELV